MLPSQTSTQKTSSRRGHPKHGDTRPRVAVIVETSHASGRNILRGIARYVREHGRWSLYHEFRNTDSVYPGWLDHWEGDGIIARVESPAIAKALATCGCPVVDVLGTITNTDFPMVHPDDEAIARMGADHLLDRGFRSFGFCGVPDLNWSLRRGEAFQRLIRENEYQCPIHVYRMDYAEESPWEHAQNQLAYWLNTLPRPAGVLASSDHHARNVIDACHRVGISVPDEIGVLGIDNDIPLCEVCDPPLSSIVTDDQLVGYEAAQLLDRLMTGRKVAAPLMWIPPSGVLTRLSTEVLAVSDPSVSEAVRFIRENALQQIRIDDIVARVHISRSLLQRRFRNALGRSLHDEIVRVRLDHAKFLLEESDLPILEVAERSGFKHQEYLGAVFKKHVGTTPSQYRKSKQRPK